MFKSEDFEGELFIGKGAFGKVYKTYSLSKGRNVAIKKIKDEDRFRYAALKEIKILNYINSLRKADIEIPIVNFYGEFMKENIQYLVFELLDIDLYTYYKNCSHELNLDNIVKIMIQICEGLSYIHTKFIHSDLKPENIMIDKKTKKIKIIDLGSSFEKNKLKKNFYVQSRYYRAPELIYELQHNEKIDIWSVGCIMFELIALKPLFKGKNSIDLIYKISEFISLPKEEEYLNSTKFNYLYCQIIDTEKFTYLHNKEKYKEPDFRLREFLYIYLDCFKVETLFKENIYDFFKDVFVYDFNLRISAKDCILQLKTIKNAVLL